MIQGLLSPKDARRRINFLELQVIALALQEFVP